MLSSSIRNPSIRKVRPGTVAGLALALLATVLLGCEEAPPLGRTDVGQRLDTAAVRTAILGTMDVQVEAWNAGDVEAFMEGYARTDSLRFASGGNVRRGWQAALDGYRRRYPDREAMGTLRFDSLDVRPLSPRHALVFGRWHLQRADDAPNGLFTLLFERRAGANGETAWRIVHDHTSTATGP